METLSISFDVIVDVLPTQWRLSPDVSLLHGLRQGNFQELSRLLWVSLTDDEGNISLEVPGEGTAEPRLFMSFRSTPNEEWNLIAHLPMAGRLTDNDYKFEIDSNELRNYPFPFIPIGSDLLLQVNDDLHRYQSDSIDVIKIISGLPTDLLISSPSLMAHEPRQLIDYDLSMRMEDSPLEIPDLMIHLLNDQDGLRQVSIHGLEDLVVEIREKYSERKAKDKITAPEMILKKFNTFFKSVLKAQEENRFNSGSILHFQFTASFKKPNKDDEKDDDEIVMKSAELIVRLPIAQPEPVKRSSQEPKKAGGNEEKVLRQQEEPNRSDGQIIGKIREIIEANDGMLGKILYCAFRDQIDTFIISKDPPSPFLSNLAAIYLKKGLQVIETDASSVYSPPPPLPQGIIGNPQYLVSSSHYSSNSSFNVYCSLSIGTHSGTS